MPGELGVGCYPGTKREGKVGTPDSRARAPEARRRNTASASKTKTQCFPSRSQEKHRQNRSKPLTQAHATNDQPVPVANPAPSPLPERGQIADICGPFRANHAGSGQAMPGRSAAGDCPPRTVPLAPKPGAATGKNRPRRIRPYPAKSGRKRPDPATLDDRAKEDQNRARNWAPAPARQTRRWLGASQKQGSGLQAHKPSRRL
jgi:hypothetical protein